MPGDLRPPEEPPDPLLGVSVAGRWRIVERLGYGSMGVVYRAETGERERVRTVALKLLHEEYLANNEFVRRFAREARALSRLQHVHCTSIFDVGEHEGRPYIVMELVPGHLLSREIGTQAMTPVRAVLLTKQLLGGLHHAHSHGIVHRDVKPDNVMIAPLPGVGDVVKILDFGFAHITDSHNSQSNANLVPGTPSYMAPEAAEGVKTDARSDLYSAGIILYELCTGLRPFVGDNPFAILTKHLHEQAVPAGLMAPERGISGELEGVIAHALEKMREQRYQTALAFQQALDGTPEGRAAARLTRKARRRAALQSVGARRIAAALAGVVLLAGGVAVVRRLGSRAAANPAATVVAPAVAPAEKPPDRPPPALVEPPDPAGETPPPAAPEQAAEEEAPPPKRPPAAPAHGARHHHHKSSHRR
jgi:serine/threonine-protein kinase